MAKYKGRTVKLNKPSRGDVKKFKVFVKNRKTGKVVKVNFCDNKLSIKKNIDTKQILDDALEDYWNEQV